MRTTIYIEIHNNKQEGKMKNRQKINEKGITLIALIITIVILIILATVTLNFGFGEDGIMDRTQDTKELTEETTKDETEKLQGIISEYSNIIGGGNITSEP